MSDVIKTDVTYRICYIASPVNNLTKKVSIYYFTGDFDKKVFFLHSDMDKKYRPLVSTDSNKAKSWNRLSSFAQFLAKYAHSYTGCQDQPMPNSLYEKFIGNSGGKVLTCEDTNSVQNIFAAEVFIEVTTHTTSKHRVNNIDKIEVSYFKFDEWYKHYWSNSEKFSKIRSQKYGGKKFSAPINCANYIYSLNSVKVPATNANLTNPSTTPVLTCTKDAVTAQIDVKSLPASKWENAETETVKRALTLASRFVPNLSFGGFENHPKNKEQYAIIEISGKKYALLKL
jgi:hypothetical protein